MPASRLTARPTVLASVPRMAGETDILRRLHHLRADDAGERLLGLLEQPLSEEFQHVHGERIERLLDRRTVFLLSGNEATHLALDCRVERPKKNFQAFAASSAAFSCALTSSSAILASSRNSWRAMASFCCDDSAVEASASSAAFWIAAFSPSSEAMVWASHCCSVIWWRLSSLSRTVSVCSSFSRAASEALCQASSADSSAEWSAGPCYRGPRRCGRW